MSRVLSRLEALALGLVVVVGLGLGGYFLFAVGSRNWFGDRALHVRAGFPAVQGVEVGTRVRLQGIDAGEVVEIHPPIRAGQDVILRLKVKSAYRDLVLNTSTVRIVSEGMLGGKVVEILPPEKGAPSDRPAEAEALLKSQPSQDLADMLAQVNKTLGGVQAGKGTLGKLLTDPHAYEALVKLLKSSNEAVEQSKETLGVAQRDLEAIKKLPILRNYIEDPASLLDRAGMERNHREFAESELFEPGGTTLTARGRRNLDDAAEWVNGFSQKGSEVVVVGYADPKKANAKTATHTTRLQAEAVVAYLKKNHKVHKLSTLRSRKVLALGQGTTAPPKSEGKTVSPPRLDVLVFVPQE